MKFYQYINEAFPSREILARTVYSKEQNNDNYLLYFDPLEYIIKNTEQSPLNQFYEPRPGLTIANHVEAVLRLDTIYFPENNYIKLQNKINNTQFGIQTSFYFKVPLSEYRVDSDKPIKVKIYERIRSLEEHYFDTLMGKNSLLNSFNPDSAPDLTLSIERNDLLKFLSDIDKRILNPPDRIYKTWKEQKGKAEEAIYFALLTRDQQIDHLKEYPRFISLIDPPIIELIEYVVENHPWQITDQDTINWPKSLKDKWSRIGKARKQIGL